MKKNPAAAAPRRAARRPARLDGLDLLDALTARCERLAMFAGLLQACGNPTDGPLLERELVGAAGDLIGEEVDRLSELLESFQKELNS